MKKLLNLAPAALAMSMSAVSAQSLGFRAEPDAPPIYLYKDAQGVAYTLDVTESQARRAIQLRPVSGTELEKIESYGFRIRYLENDKNESSSKSSGPGTDATAITYITSLPQSFSIFQTGVDAYGNFAVVGNQQPPKLTQWVVFNYKSANMYNIGIHAPIVLLVDTQQLAGGFPPTYAPALVGNGIEIGDVGLTPGGCGFANTTPVYNSQIETFSNGSNKLYPTACTTSGLQDGVTYQYIVHANTNGWVSYSVSGGMTFGVSEHQHLGRSTIWISRNAFRGRIVLWDSPGGKSDKGKGDVLYECLYWLVLALSARRDDSGVAPPGAAPVHTQEYGAPGQFLL